MHPNCFHIGESSRREQGGSAGETEVGATGAAPVAGSGSPSDTKTGREAGGRDAAPVGPTLRFALTARPTGSQGCAPGRANDQKQTEPNSTKGDILNEVIKGTFLKSFDKLQSFGLTFF